MQTDADASTRFVWPPRGDGLPPGPEGLARPAPEPARAIEVRRPAPAPPGRLAARVREIERVWLGLTVPPLPERMAEHGWWPDEPSAYCQRCGATVGPHDADDTGCSACRARRLPWERLLRLGEFEGLLRELVHEVKFTRWRRLGDQLGRMLGQQLADAATAAGIPPASFVVVPVPASFRRRMYRGIDHALVIARGVAAGLDCRLERALERQHRPSQARLPKTERARNVAGAFRVRVGMAPRLVGRHLVVVDDVTTTRATLMAACRGLRDGLKHPAGVGNVAGERIWAAVVAVTPDPARRRPSGSAGEPVGVSAEIHPGRPKG